LAIIVVNAQKEHDISFAKRDYSIPLIDTLGAASSVPLDQYSYETMELLRNNIDKWRASMTAGRCRKMKEKNTVIKDVSTEKSKCAVHTYLIEVNFDAIEDESERKHLESLSTSFHLEPEDVDRLREAAKKILTQSEEFQSLVEGLE
jgi:NTE family protein